MPDLGVLIDTQARTINSLDVEVDTQAISYVRLGVEVDSRTIGGPSITAGDSVRVDTVALRVGAPLGVQVDSRAATRQSLPVQVDSQIKNFGELSAFVDTQVVTRKSLGVDVDTVTKKQTIRTISAIVDTIVGKRERAISALVDTQAIPAGKIFNAIFLSNHYPYPPIED